MSDNHTSTRLTQTQVPGGPTGDGFGPVDPCYTGDGAREDSDNDFLFPQEMYKDVESRNLTEFDRI